MQPCIGQCMGLHFSPCLHWSSTRLYHHPLRRHPAAGPQVTRPRETSHPWYGISLAVHDVHDPCLVHLFLEATGDDIHSSQFCATSRATSRTPPVEERPEQLLPHMARSCAKTKGRTDPLAMRSICADEVERALVFRERRSRVERLATSAACRHL